MPDGAAGAAGAEGGVHEALLSYLSAHPDFAASLSHAQVAP